MLVCGIDEAGRGPIAGPLTAAAVILPPDFPIEVLRDSKKTTELQRKKLFPLIYTQSVCSVSWVWPEEIDRINIHQAALLGMQRAFHSLSQQPDTVLVDGKFTPGLPVPCEAVIKGDDKIPEIQAASILAKYARDQWMIRWSWLEQQYDFDKHKGYPTRHHRNQCKVHGLSEIHRKSFTISFPS